MKKRAILALITAALLTSCASGGNGYNSGYDTSGSPAESGSAGTPGAASHRGSADAGTPADASAPAVSAATPSNSGEPTDVTEPTVITTTSGSTSAPETTKTPAETTKPAATTSAKPASTHSDPTGSDYTGKDIGGTGRSDDIIYSDDIAYDVAGDMDYIAEAAAVDGSYRGGDYIDPGCPIDPIEPIDPVEPFPGWDIDPQAGLLTGGEWNDNQHWDFWQGLYSSNNYGVDWDSYLSEWRTGAEYRIAVRIIDSSGAPVPGALVDGMGYSAVTDNKGMAYLFGKKSGIGDYDKSLTVSYGSQKQTFAADDVTGDCELEFTLDGDVTPHAKTLDLMIMCDTTGSMGDELEYLKAELEDVVTRIRQDNANIPTRISVNFYRDEGDEYVVREFPFTTDLEAAVRAISEQSADGGGDTPEAVHTALDSALSHDWDENSVKVMFLVLDAPPHEDAQIIDEVVKHVRNAAEKGIRIVPVAASGVDKSCEYLLRSMAFMTGGTYTFLTDDSGIGYSHTEPTIGSYSVEKLNDMMVRIVNGYLE